MPIDSIDICGFIPSRLLHLYRFVALLFWLPSQYNRKRVVSNANKISIDINKNQHITQMHAKLKPSQKLTNSMESTKQRVRSPNGISLWTNERKRRYRGRHNFIGSIGIRYTNCEHVSDFQCLIQRQQVLHGWKFTLTKTGECKWIAHRSYTNEGCYFCLACVRPRAICVTLKSKAFTWYWHKKDNFYFKDAAKSAQNYFLQWENWFILATR